MAATGFKGIDVRQTTGNLVLRTLLQSSSGTLVTSGTVSVYLYELQSDATIKSFDFSDNTFKTGALTTETFSATHQKGNNNTTNTGVWTIALSALTGFTTGAIYLATFSCSGASPPQTVQQFQFGSAEGDVVAAFGGVNLNLTQAITSTSTGDTLNGALLAARAQGFGKWVFSGLTLTLYAADGVTVVRTFTFDSSSTPTTRT